MGSVLGQVCEKMEYGKRVKKRVGKGHARNEFGGSGGGQRRGGRLRLAALQVLAFGIYPARPATSDEVRRISVACGEFRPRRLKQNLAVVIQKCIISDAWESHF